MRLSKIKIAGFKSFVDPTVIQFPVNLMGVVGPNGCGKSNVIDAVRWVMGESSARYLRGESMEDVIFNGSSSRKPVGQASIELVFDNSDGAVGGEYARYVEISIRRQVSRDGQSVYFLNGSRCRRRDITDLFLGTGLGPRSYAIIEQGMISRIIEARPDELRAYIEEAAGISKYKERRRETESRMEHTRANLERLNDVREEIGKQLDHLQKQAETAERYTALRAEERRLRAELLVLRLRDLAADLETREIELRGIETEAERHLAEVRQLEAGIEALLQEREAAGETFNAVQARFYEIGNHITRVEQAIRHHRELHARQVRERDDARTALAQAESNRALDQCRLDELQQTLAVLEPQWEATRAAQSSAHAELAAAEEDLRIWQRTWDTFNQRAAEPTQRALVERARMEQLERHSQQLREREARLAGELDQFDAVLLEEELDALQFSVEQQHAALEEAQRAVAALQAEVEARRALNRERRAQLEGLHRDAQQARGRLASLETLQQSALGKAMRGAAADWLKRHRLDGERRIGELIEVEPTWSLAVELVLGDWLEAVTTEDWATVAGQLAELGDAHLALCGSGQTGFERSPAPGTLAARVKGPAVLREVLERVRIAPDVETALALRDTLGAGESVVTPLGFWCARDWARWGRTRDTRAGVLDRKQEIHALRERLAALEGSIEQLEGELEDTRVEVRQLEERTQTQQAAVNQAHRAFAEARARLSRQQLQVEQLGERKLRAEAELADVHAQLREEQAALVEATEARNEALLEVEQLEEERGRLLREKEGHQARVDTARRRLQEASDALHRLTVQRESGRVAEQATRESLSRTQRQMDAVRERLALLDAALEEGDSPLAALQDELHGWVGAQAAVDEELRRARETVQTLDHGLRERERARHAAEKAANEQRALAEGLRLQRQEILVRQRGLLEQLSETEFELAALRDGLDPAAQATEWEQRIERLVARIQRLGPINLAAIEEFRELSERKTYLDSQNEDLMQALATLDGAIEKIDRETRTRFRETFDTVNGKLQETFPKLFGGGQAYLELTEENLLTSGVTIMARPPGKRNSSIHLLSGGEKALTAVALVFAIFELNPAPFCMLDEVDAPLDEANVGRFCELVRQMSQRVQFVFITHNKTTMELAECLVGVTMREPGVSRLVDVNVEEAVKMATA